MKPKFSLPPQLVKALSENRCILFFGAGVSINAGLPSGKELSNLLADELKEDFGNDDAKHGKLGELERDKDDLKRMSQLYDDYYGTGRRASQKIAEILANKQRTARKEVIEPLRSLPTIKEIITTNYDQLIEDVLDPTDRQVIYRADDLRQTNKQKINLIKLHGTLTDVESMVLTTQDYNKFSKDRVALIDEIKSLFRKKILIIIGYSLEDENFGKIYEETIGTANINNYFVSPDKTVFQELHWEKRGFQHIPLNAEDFLNALKQDFAIASYGEKTAKFTEKPTIVSDPLYNPFILYDTEALADQKPQLLSDTFVSPVGFSNILNHQHTFIEGHRGSGKSTILWRLSIKSRAFDKKTDLPMWGFYIKMVPGLFSAFRRKVDHNLKFIETNEEWTKYFTHYFNLILLSGILKHIGEAIDLGVLQTNEKVKDVVETIAKSLLRLEKTDAINDLRTLKRSVDVEIDSAAFDRAALPFYTLATFISRALDILADAIPELRTKPWHILLDEYDNVYPEQQAVINVILRERNEKIRYKIAVKTLHAYLKDIDGKTLDPIDDYGYISCDSIIWDKTLKPQYFDFLEKLSQQRLSYAGFSISIHDLLPDAKDKNEYYAGFKAFCYLSSGLTRMYLELCKDAVYEAYPESATNRVDLKPIPVTIQNHVAKIHSAILFKSYRGTPDPQRVLRLFKVFGSLFRAIAKATAQQDEKRKPLSFEIGDLDQLSEESLEILENTVKSRLLQVPTLPKQPRNALKDSPALKYSFHRLLAPFFKLSLTERYAEPIKASSFNQIWTNPDAVIAELSAGYKSKGINKYLDNILPLYDQYEVEQEEFEDE